MRTKWDEVMDAQLGVAEVFTVEHAERVVPWKGWSEDRRRDWATIVHLGARALRGAAPVFIEEDILDIGEHACKSFVPEPAHASDFFTPSGFALFERPVVLAPVTPHAGHPERPLYSNACLWHWELDHQGVLCGLLSFFQHIRSDAQVADTIDTVHPYHFQHPWSQVGFIIMEENTTPEFETAVNAAPDDSDDEEINVELHGVKLVQTLMRLAQQPLTQKVEALAPRAARRRAMRAGQDFGKNITTITLRRTKRELHEDHEAKKANYSHRFIVHGFWRNQWFPSLQRHKQMWIHDFVKGDPDLPLVIKERRYDFRR